MSALESHPDPPCDYLQETRYAARWVCWMQPLLRLGTVQMFILFSTTHIADAQEGRASPRQKDSRPKQRNLHLPTHIPRPLEGPLPVSAPPAVHERSLLLSGWSRRPGIPGRLPAAHVASASAPPRPSVWPADARPGDAFAGEGMLNLALTLWILGCGPASLPPRGPCGRRPKWKSSQTQISAPGTYKRTHRRLRGRARLKGPPIWKQGTEAATYPARPRAPR